MVEKAFTVEIAKADGTTFNTATFYEDDIERVGGIGAIVESIEPFLKEDWSIEVAPHYYK